MYHEDIVYPILPMFSTFDWKMVNVVENAECFRWFLLKCKCLWPTTIYSRVLSPYCLYLSDVSRKEENIHGIQEKLTDNILFKQCHISHIQQPGAGARAGDEGCIIDHGHSLTAASQNENINVWQKHKSRLPLLGSGGWSLYPPSSVTLCIRYPAGLSAVNWCIQLMTGSAPGRGGSK